MDEYSQAAAAAFFYAYLSGIAVVVGTAFYYEVRDARRARAQKRKARRREAQQRERALR